VAGGRLGGQPPRGEGAVGGLAHQQHRRSRSWDGGGAGGGGEVGGGRKGAAMGLNRNGFLPGFGWSKFCLPVCA
jgi:hypothetical protein